MNSEPHFLQADTNLIRSFSFLLKAYDFSSEYTERSVPIWDIGKVMGLSEPEAEEAASDLQELNLVYYSSLAGDIALTSFGMSEIVLAQTQPQLPTTHFPPLASMSAQMMLPLSASSLTASSSSGSTESGVTKLVDQLESFREELALEQGGRFDLSETMQMLDDTLHLSTGNQRSLITELESIHFDLL